METFADIIRELGGPAEYGRAVGISTERAAEQRSRNSIAPAYWPAIVNAANERGRSDITADLLADIYAHRRQLTRAAS